MSRIIYTMNVFRRSDEEWLSSHEIKDLPLCELQKAFDVPEDDPMFARWEVEGKHVPLLEKHTGIKINLDKFYCSVGGVAVQE